MKYACGLGVVGMLVSAMALGQAVGQEPRGAIASVLNVDSTNDFGTVRIVNSSDRDITAVSVSYAGVYADGKTVHGERLVDFLPAMTSDQVALGPASSSEGAFHPGESEQEPVSFPKIPGNQLRRIDVHVQVVAYSDLTVEIGDDAAFGRLLDERKASLLAKQTAIDMIGKELDSAASLHPVASVIATKEKEVSMLAAHTQPRRRP